MDSSRSKNAAALTNISNGELGPALTLHSNACLNQGRSARGRVLLQIVFNHYSSGKNAEPMYDINHLQEISLKGEHLEAFRNNWLMVLSELRTQPDPDILRHCYFRQIQYFKPLAEDISHYRRAKHLPDKSDYSFEYLFESANRYLLMKRDDAMQDALSRGLMGTTDRAAPGIPQRPKGKGKGD